MINNIITMLPNNYT